MSELVKVIVSKEFSPVPSGRYYGDGRFSGQAFRDKISPLIKAGDAVELDIDGVESLPSSFLEEVFGGLLREGIPASVVRSNVKITTTERELERYVKLAWRFVSEQEGRMH